MYNSQLRREKYLRKKDNILKKCCSEECEAYRRIKEKFLLNDYEIKRLLMDYTVTEILEWEFEDNKFIPKELIKIFVRLKNLLGLKMVKLEI